MILIKKKNCIDVYTVSHLKSHLFWIKTYPLFVITTKKKNSLNNHETEKILKFTVCNKARNDNKQVINIS